MPSPEGTQIDAKGRQQHFPLDPSLLSATSKAQHLIAEFLADKSAVPNPMEIAAMAVYAEEAGGITLSHNKPNKVTDA